MPHAWRIVKARHAKTAFDGEGARRFGGRWNSQGRLMVYLAESRALAILEVLVHLEDEGLLASYVLCEVEYAARDAQVLAVAKLPSDWAATPLAAGTQRLGDAWLDTASSAILSVPSAVVPEERILLLNPKHTRFGSIRIGPAKALRIDRRLVKPR